MFVDVGANVGTYALALARHVGASGKVIAIEPHPVTHARLAFNRAASGRAGDAGRRRGGNADGELMIETDGENLGASHIVPAPAPAMRSGCRRPGCGYPQPGRIPQVDALKIDVEGFEDRVLIGFFRGADDAVAARGRDRTSVARRMAGRLPRRHAARGYAEPGKTRSNTFLLKS